MLIIDPRLVTIEEIVREPEPDVANVESAPGSPGPQRLKNLVECEHARDWSLPGRLLVADSGAKHMGGGLAEFSGLDAVRFDGDVATLPFDDATFATVVAIDAVGAATWMQQCDELLRVVRAGGHLIVNVESLDHYDAVLHARGGEAAHPKGLLPRLGIDAIAAFARSRGLSIRAIRPYGALLGRLVESRWFGDGSQAEADRLDRLVSWIGTDEEICALAAFIERRVIGALTPRCAPRTIVVFAREPDAAGVPEPIARIAGLDAAIATRWLDLETIAARHPGGAAAWRLELADLLAGERARIFAAALYAHAPCGPPWPGFTAHLPPALLCEFARAQRFDRSAAEAARLAVRWPDVVGSALVFHGVRLGPALAPAVRRELAGRLRAAR